MTAYTVFPKGGDVQEGSEQWRPKGPQGTQNSQSPGSRETTPPLIALLHCQPSLQGWPPFRGHHWAPGTSPHLQAASVPRKDSPSTWGFWAVA